jgi:hypothetical protein
MSTITVTKEEAIAAFRSEPVRVRAKPVVLAMPAATPENGQHKSADVAQKSGESSSAKPEAKDATKKTNGWLRLAIVAASIIAVVVGWLITVHYTHDPAIKFGSAVPKALDGLTIFAVFFVAAAAIERLLEPISGLLPDKADLKQEADDQKAKAGKALTQNATKEDAEKALATAAEKQAHAKDWVFGQTIGFWALATILGIIASALLRLYLPYVVGIASGGRAIQILATGLIIGGGTKPLHDLIGYMTAAKDAKEEK